LDNTDIVPHVYGALDKYIVLDTKLHYDLSRNLSFDFGIHNVLNEQYFLFHPFPRQTYVVAGRYRF
jgi:iron complex outermembrane recepter protein